MPANAFLYSEDSFYDIPGCFHKIRSSNDLRASACRAHDPPPYPLHGPVLLGLQRQLSRDVFRREDWLQVHPFPGTFAWMKYLVIFVDLSIHHSLRVGSIDSTDKIHTNIQCIRCLKSCAASPFCLGTRLLAVGLKLTTNKE